MGMQFVAVLVGTLVMAHFLVRRRTTLGVLVALLCLVAVWQIESHQPERVDEANVTDRPIAVKEREYVSSKACQACHPEQYRTWHRSYHRTMTQAATPQTVLGRFDGEAITVLGNKCRPVREGDEFFIELDVRDRTSGRISRQKKPIVMTTGSHNRQHYWFATERNRMGELAPLNCAAFKTMKIDPPTPSPC